MLDLIRINSVSVPRYSEFPDGLYFHEDYIDFIKGDFSFEIVVPVTESGHWRNWRCFVFRSRQRDGWYNVNIVELMALCEDRAPEALEWIMFNLEMLT